MNKTPYLLAASVVLMATAPTAFAQSQIYGKLGANMSSSTSISPTSSLATFDAKSGLMPEVTLGYDWGNGFAVELNYQKSGGDLNSITIVNHYEHTITAVPTATASGKMIFQSTMIKGIYNIQTDTTDLYNPYIGLGLGKTNVAVKDLSIYKEDGTPSSPGGDDGSATSMQLTLGNRFTFNQGWFGDIAIDYTHIKAFSFPDSSNNKGTPFDSTKVTSISFAVGKSF